MREGHTKALHATLRLKEMVYIMISTENTQHCTFLNTNQNVQLKLVNFIVCKVNLNKAEFKDTEKPRGTWVARLSARLLISAQVMILGL